jgi:hypothetical protein
MELSSRFQDKNAVANISAGHVNHIEPTKYLLSVNKSKIIVLEVSSCYTTSITVTQYNNVYKL